MFYPARRYYSSIASVDTPAINFRSRATLEGDERDSKDIPSDSNHAFTAILNFTRLLFSRKSRLASLSSVEAIRAALAKADNRKRREREE